MHSGNISSSQHIALRSEKQCWAGGAQHLLCYSNMQAGLLHCSEDMTAGVQFIKLSDNGADFSRLFLKFSPLGVNRIDWMEVVHLVGGN